MLALFIAAKRLMSPDESDSLPKSNFKSNDKFASHAEHDRLNGSDSDESIPECPFFALSYVPRRPETTVAMCAAAWQVCSNISTLHIEPCVLAN